MKTAVAKGDLAAAKRALAQLPQPPDAEVVSRRREGRPKPEKPNTARADRVLRHEMESIGLRHQFGPEIDWTFDLTTAPGSNYAPNNEWTWQLNRHADWSALARAYRDTGDERYAREFAAQMMQWVRTCPVPESAANGARSTWRTIEAGIRAAQVWPNLFYHFLLSPEFTDEALVTMVKSFAEHAMYLLPHPTTGNWLCMEGNGLFHVGVLFPEFKDAAKWRDTAVEWLYAEMENQVYPDGVQIELSSGYHHVSLSNFLGVFRLPTQRRCAAGGLPKRIERMATSTSMPRCRIAAPVCRMAIWISEGHWVRPPGFPTQGVSLRHRWQGGRAARNSMPSHAGYFIMRSAGAGCRWMLFDGGPAMATSTKQAERDRACLRQLLLVDRATPARGPVAAILHRPARTTSFWWMVNCNAACPDNYTSSRRVAPCAGHRARYDYVCHLDEGSASVAAGGAHPARPS